MSGRARCRPAIRAKPVEEPPLRRGWTMGFLILGVLAAVGSALPSAALGIPSSRCAQCHGDEATAGFSALLSGSALGGKMLAGLHD